MNMTKSVLEALNDGVFEISDDELAELNDEAKAINDQIFIEPVSDDDRVVLKSSLDDPDQELRARIADVKNVFAFSDDGVIWRIYSYNNDNGDYYKLVLVEDKVPFMDMSSKLSDMASHNK